MYSTSHIHISAKCPSCSETNYITDIDPSDVYAIECYACHCSFWILSEEEVKDSFPIEFVEDFAVVGSPGELVCRQLPDLG